MYEYQHTHRVRYRECDPMGIVYHAHYVDYFEAARTEMIRAFGIPYSEIERRGHLIQVIQVNVRYHSPAFYDDELTITVRVDEVPKMRFTIHNEVRRTGEDKLLASGRVELCFVDAASKRPIRVPEYFVSILKEYVTT